VRASFLFCANNRQVTEPGRGTLKPSGGSSRGTQAAETAMFELTVLFDGNCKLCRASAQRAERFDHAHRIEFLDLHDPETAKRFPEINREEAMRWMQAVDSKGNAFSGSDAWAQIGRRLPGWNLLAWILLVPGIRQLAGKVYAWVARNRYRWNRAACEGGACSLHIEKKPTSHPQTR
jgi:predicted DCC family thiol-disulfide oxidoreductase YuxK